MKIVEFYRCQAPNQVGCYLYDMWAFTHGEYEVDHDYVQWLFPSNEMSMLNGDAPVLTEEEAAIFIADPELKDRVKYSFIKILDFFGFRLIESGGMPQVEPLENEESRNWLKYFNHNMLRVTRILKCLRLTGLTEYAIAFYGALQTYRQYLSPNTLGYWQRALTEPLWPEEQQLLS